MPAAGTTSQPFCMLTQAAKEATQSVEGRRPGRLEAVPASCQQGQAVSGPGYLAQGPGEKEEKRIRAERSGVTARVTAPRPFRPRLTACRSGSLPWRWRRSFSTMVILTVGMASELAHEPYSRHCNNGAGSRISRISCVFRGAVDPGHIGATRIVQPERTGAQDVVSFG